MQKRSKLIALIVVVLAIFGSLAALNAHFAAFGRSNANAPVPVHTDLPPQAGPSSPSDSPSQSGSPSKGSDSRILVVYFSMTGQNYGGRNLRVGNTEHVAQFIHERVGGDIYRIRTVHPYPTNYDDIVSQAEQELDDHVFPEIAGDQPDTDDYDTVFLGYPIWWGEQPMPVQTFMRDHNLNGKTVVPFVTHEGSGFGNSLAVLHEYYPKATIRDGYQKRGTDVQDDLPGTQNEVNQWLQGLAY
jgi:flavodoxin